MPQWASGAATAANNNRCCWYNRALLPETQALKTALDSDSTSTDDIKAKLQALRDARKKSVAELEQARAGLGEGPYFAPGSNARKHGAILE